MCYTQQTTSSENQNQRKPKIYLTFILLSPPWQGRICHRGPEVLVPSEQHERGSQCPPKPRPKTPIPLSPRPHPLRRCYRMLQPATTLKLNNLFTPSRRS